jgi:hypothetical protein
MTLGSSNLLEVARYRLSLSATADKNKATFLNDIPNIDSDFICFACDSTFAGVSASNCVLYIVNQDNNVQSTFPLLLLNVALIGNKYTYLYLIPNRPENIVLKNCYSINTALSDPKPLGTFNDIEVIYYNINNNAIKPNRFEYN